MAVASKRRYNPNQPRYPAGTRAGGRWKDMAALVQANRRRTLKQATDPGKIAPWVDSELDEKGDKIRNQSFETSVMYDGDGMVIAEADGSESSVTLEVPGSARFTVYAHLHNHPDGSSFSPQDLDNVFAFPAAEMRVVTADRDIMMHPGPAGWGSRDAFRSVLNEVYPARMAGIPWDRDRQGRPTDKVSGWGDEEWFRISDSMWREVAPRLGWRYTVEERNA